MGTLAWELLEFSKIKDYQYAQINLICFDFFSIGEPLFKRELLMNHKKGLNQV